MLRALRLPAVLAASVLAGSAAAQVSGSRPEDSLRQPDSLLDGAAHERRSQVALYGMVVWGYGFGAAARFTLPLLQDGVLPELNDSIEVDLGGDIIFPSFGIGVVALGAFAEPRWTFHFTPQVDAYVKLGVGVLIPFGGTVPTSVYVPAMVGVAYRVASNLTARLEAGNFGSRVGVALDF